MSAVNDGGPAFPVIFEHTEATSEQEGMTLRDRFAEKAIVPVLTGATIPEESWTEVLPMVARFAYAMADAMLKAREA